MTTINTKLDKLALLPKKKRKTSLEGKGKLRSMSTMKRIDRIVGLPK